jgi:hypothetical protein
MVSICSWTDNTSPTVVAFDMMVRYCCSLVCRAEMRACRLTYWPVTLVAWVVRFDVVPKDWACFNTEAKVSTGTCSVMLP